MNPENGVVVDTTRVWWVQAETWLIEQVSEAGNS